MGIGASLLLIAIGAILAFALQLDPTPFAGMTIDWVVVGYILAIVGIVGLIWSLVLFSQARRSETYIEDDRPRRRVID